jgi:alanine racemase
MEDYSGETLNIHLKVDTGLARMGFTDDEFASVLPRIVEQKNVVIEGVWTHLADAENPASYHTNTQIERFKKIKNVCSEHAIHPLFHVGASAATMLFAASHEDLVRVGVSMYGMWPSDETRESVENSDVASNFTLKPAFSYKTMLVQTKKLSQGALVGYGCTYRVRKDTVLGVVPVGYAEGLPRLLSNNGHMLLRGKKVPIIGNVCMNMTMLDITGVTEAKVGDEVVIIGTMGEEVITPEDHAKWTNTINYEVTTRISERVPRVYV